MKQNIEQEKSIINETLLNSIPGGIIIVKVVENNIECLYFNEAFAKLSGRTHDELQRYLDSGVNVIDIIYEADRKKFLTSILCKIQSDNEVDERYRYYTATGNVQWINLVASKIREEDGCPVFYCACTKLSDELDLYINLSDESPVATYVAEKKERRILYANAEWKKIENIPQDINIIGKSVYELIPAERIIFSEKEINELTSQAYRQIHIKRNNRYYSLGTKSYLWNDIDAYMVYFVDETESILKQQKKLEIYQAELKTREEMSQDIIASYQINLTKNRIERSNFKNNYANSTDDVVNENTSCEDAVEYFIGLILSDEVKKEITSKKKILKEIKQKIKTLQKVSLFVYMNGDIEAENFDIPEKEQTGCDKYFDDLLKNEVVEELSIKQIRQLAKLLVLLELLKEKELIWDITFESKVQQDVFEKLPYSIIEKM